MNSYLEVSHISHQYGKTPVLHDCSFRIQQGELIALLGESGSGKTTLLRLIAGFERPSSGKITLKGNTLCDSNTFVLPERRNIGLVFQDYALFPHLNVARNIEIGRKGSNSRKAADWLSVVGLEGLEDRKPDELSGGQQQRVAIARAMAAQPDVILLDEPFSNIDESLKFSFRASLKELLRKEKTTSIFVTHDTKDALAIADRIVIIQKGVIKQVGTPLELYKNPIDLEIAGLFGPYNIIENNASTIQVLRAEDCSIQVGPGKGDSIFSAPAKVANSMYQGGHFLIELSTEKGKIMCHSPVNYPVDTDVVFTYLKSNLISIKK